MRILAIETSCDETAIAVIEATREEIPPPTPLTLREVKKDVNFKILSSHISSQVKIHRPFGGVVPNLAKREHQKNLPILLRKVMEDINLTPLPPLLRKERGTINGVPSLRVRLANGGGEVPDIDAIAVTSGPGLEPALWQGITFSQELAKNWKLPLVAVNHLEGHIYSAFMHGNKFAVPKNIFPLLTLIVSGGHTELVLVKKHLSYKILGETLDDAAGEAFDKVARMLGLPYPGGPEISKIAKKGNPKAINFPRPMMNSKDLNFSFSGLKTAVLYKIRELTPFKLPTADIAASFEQAAVDVLVSKTLKAVAQFKPKTVALGGGVAANDKLRNELSHKLHAIGHTILLPEKQFTGDNASMIAVAAYFKVQKKQFANPGSIKANGHLKL